MSKASRITVEGKIAADVEIRQAGNSQVAEVTIPHTRRRKNGQGQWEDAGETTWFKAPFWGDDAVKVAGLTKGTEVVVSGELEVKPYLKRDGSAGASALLLFPTIGVVPGAQSPAPAVAPTFDEQPF